MTIINKGRLYFSKCLLKDQRNLRDLMKIHLNIKIINKVKSNKMINKILRYKNFNAKI